MLKPWKKAHNEPYSYPILWMPRKLINKQFSPSQRSPLSTTLTPTPQHETMAQPVHFVICKSQIGCLNCITVQTVAADSASFFATHCHFSSFTFEDVYCICWCSLSVMLYPPPGGPRTAFLPHINFLLSQQCHRLWLSLKVWLWLRR